jgi:PIN domain nuclease of toxin-antitoxin system
MNYLLDTHAVLWFFGNVEKLSKKALEAILEPTSKKYVSIVSAWELAIKISLKKLNFEGGVDNFFKVIDENGFELLPLNEEYIKQVEILPLHHRDPFDRLLIATAISEEMSIITIDENIYNYNISYVW